MGKTEQGLAHANVKEATISVMVIRANGTREDLGEVSYWHRNPIKRVAWKLRRAVNGLVRN